MVTLRDYKPIVGEEEVRRIEELAFGLEGLEVTHVNATKYGGGVAEMLSRLIPLLSSLGLRARWEALKGDSFFFEITKSIHNSLQGNKDVKITEEMWSHYLEVNERNRGLASGDVVVIHDPQPLPLVEGRDKGVWIWRCHIDPSQANEEVLSFLVRFIRRYDASIYSLEDYVIPSGVKSYIVHPAIDPLSEKNRQLDTSYILRTLEKYDVDPDRPVIGQVSRYDPWKDPVGVIRTFRKVKEVVEDVQLVMVGSSASDDPEGDKWFELTSREAEGLPDVHLLRDLPDLEVNAIQRSYAVALQLSTREGFGLTVTEALWKGVPVVARPSGGIRLQVLDGVTGFLVNGVEEAAQRVVQLIRRPWLSRLMGSKGRELVRERFLITRLLKDHLRIIKEMTSDE